PHRRVLVRPRRAGHRARPAPSGSATPQSEPVNTLARQKESRRTAAVSSTTSPFGQNEWLVEEMYRKFRDDPSSVDPSWHEFLVDYNPEPVGEAAAAANGQPGVVRATAPAPAPAPSAPA